MRCSPSKEMEFFATVFVIQLCIQGFVAIMILSCYYKQIYLYDIMKIRVPSTLEIASHAMRYYLKLSKVYLLAVWPTFGRLFNNCIVSDVS